MSAMWDRPSESPTSAEGPGAILPPPTPAASPREPDELAGRDEILPVEREGDQPGLFRVEEVPFDWQREWAGMPEFVMGDTKPVQKITIQFASWEDVRAFGRLLDQPVTRQTDSLWFPKPTDYLPPRCFLYVDGGEE